jgi:anti-sigma regulatory factor (Ser/Thr protein kinase)
VSLSTAPLAQTYPPVATSVPQARWALTELAIAFGASGDQLDAVRLAVSEAMTSAVVRAEGQISVTATPGADGLDVSITDDGALRQPGLIGQKGGSGPAWGLALIAQSTDQLAIAKRPAGGTELWMHFALDGVSQRT